MSDPPSVRADLPNSPCSHCGSGAQLPFLVYLQSPSSLNATSSSKSSSLQAPTRAKSHLHPVKTAQDLPLTPAVHTVQKTVSQGPASCYGTFSNNCPFLHSCLQRGFCHANRQACSHSWSFLRACSRAFLPRQLSRCLAQRGSYCLSLSFPLLLGLFSFKRIIMNTGLHSSSLFIL